MDDRQFLRESGERLEEMLKSEEAATDLSSQLDSLSL